MKMMTMRRACYPNFKNVTLERGGERNETNVES